MKVTDYDMISQGAEGESDMYNEMMKSPMSICVDAESWQLYMGGVVDSSTCGQSLDHCVQAIGLKVSARVLCRGSGGIRTQN